jgi:8-oxo-dGTP pyrophosphatase MutT (NUDIX family)
MTRVAVPAPAATLILLREGRHGGVEVLLGRRHADSRFAGGDHVFAGGKLTPEDMPADAEQFCRGLTAEAAAERLGEALTPRDALGYWVGAVREAFEEVGLLLAYVADGRLIRFTARNRARFAAHRAACQIANARFFDMLRAESLTLATDQLIYVAHWITPEENAIRFDTRFFAAPSPPGQEAEADGQEIVGARWFTPEEALAARARGEIPLRLPTAKNLELLSGATSLAGLLERLAGLGPIRAIRPRVLTADGNPFPVLPGDPRWY